MAGAGGDATLYEDTFTVMELDHSKYDRVARIAAKSNDNQTEMKLDINIELFPCTPGETLHLVLATSLALDGSRDDEKGWRDATKGRTDDDVATLADIYDYVCYGKIYKFEDKDDGQLLNALISFGGLLMSLNGPYKKLTPLRVDYVYLLIKK